MGTYPIYPLPKRNNDDDDDGLDAIIHLMLCMANGPSSNFQDPMNHLISM